MLNHNKQLMALCSFKKQIRKFSTTKETLVTDKTNWRAHTSDSSPMRYGQLQSQSLDLANTSAIILFVLNCQGSVANVSSLTLTKETTHLCPLTKNTKEFPFSRVFRLKAFLLNLETKSMSVGLFVISWRRNKSSTNRTCHLQVSPPQSEQTKPRDNPPN